MNHEHAAKAADTAPQCGYAEANVGRILQQQRLQDELFVADKISTLGDYLFDMRSAEASVVRSYERLGRSRPFDVLQCHTLNGAGAVVPFCTPSSARGARPPSARCPSRSGSLRHSPS